MRYLVAALVFFITAVHGIPNVTVFAKGMLMFVFCVSLPVRNVLMFEKGKLATFASRSQR